MPTPGERRALLFIAAVAALGVAVRGYREFRPLDSGALAGNRSALARQIEAVDSAISVTSSKRKPRAAAKHLDTIAGAPKPRASRPGAREKFPLETLPRDPRQSYWDRVAHIDSIRQGLDAREEKSALRRPSSQPSSSVRRLPYDQVRRLPSQQPPIDLDIASLDEVAALPMIGPALARRIINDRINNGPFGDITRLERVPGISSTYTHRLAPYVTFSLTPRQGSTGQNARSKSDRRAGGVPRP